MREDLRNLSLDETRALCGRLGAPAYRAEQLFRWVHQHGVTSFDEMSNLPEPLREKLAEAFTLGTIAVDATQVSRDGTRKLRLKTADGRFMETVLIPDGDARAANEIDDSLNDDQESEAAEPAAPVPEHLEHALFPRRPKLTQCVSSQVGCALDCTFCATAKLGFGRNLTVGEILDQVYHARAIVKGLQEDDATRRAGSDRITNLVFMGMGEPLHNYANVLASLRILMDQRGADFSKRRITVSTAGLVPAIEKFSEEPGGVPANLAISLNATTDAVRDEIMPINRKWNIARLLDACRKVSTKLDRKRRITFEYVLLDGVNDSLDDANRLVNLLRGIPSKINLLPWNPHEGAPYGRPTETAVRNFQALLRERGAAVYVRRSRGDDIDAACGQLAAKGTTAQLVPAETLIQRK